MTNQLNQLKKDLALLINPEKAAFFPRFFKTGKGQYGEGDQFLGVTVPDQRTVAKKYKQLTLAELKELLNSPIHEHRLVAILILVHQFEKGDETSRKKIYEFYLKHKARVNNWDLVDSSAHKIVGPYLEDKPREILFELAESESLWDRRIAMMSCFYFIRNNDFDDALRVAEMLVDDRHDLIHKAVGWMIREIGARDEGPALDFLRRHQDMPRTMWRYATEKGLGI